MQEKNIVPFHFNKNDIDELHRILRKYDPEKVRYFIISLQGLIMARMWHPKDSAILDKVKDLEALVKTLKKAVRQVESFTKPIQKGPWCLLNHLLDKINDDLDKNRLVVEKIKYQQQEIINLINLLEEIIQALKNTMPSMGRPSSDPDGFVAAINNVYKELIDRPTHYKDGNFFEIVRIFLRAIGCPAKDPRRLVEKALKAK